MAGALGAAAFAACLLSLALIRLLHPLLVRYALARPNARSSHAVPTPQGGGIAVLGAALAAAAGLAAWTGIRPDGATVAAGAGAVTLALLGAADDIRPLPAWPRLLVQAVCVAGVVAGGEGRVLPAVVPVPLEMALLVLAGLWWVNLVNFMDGIDWMSVVACGPWAAILAGLGLAGWVGPGPAVVMAGLAGGLAGFAPANRPVARLFLGDVGSLPIGLLTGWALLDLARHGAPAAALLLPLYYGADATLTLLIRARAGERVWEAHRTHYYQRALANGFTVPDVNRAVLGLNLALAGLAGATLLWPGLLVAVVCLAAGAALVAATLRRFARGRGRAGAGGRGKGSILRP